MVLVLTSATKAQQIYFPPVNQNAQWETTSPASLGWCQDKIDTLYQYLQMQNTKAFIVLKDGKIVLEKYFGTFTQDSSWYWASAGKSLTAMLVGKAQESGELKITDATSKYLGKGWTVCTPEQEDKITIRHQLTMTSGLDDGIDNSYCTADTCLQYLADAGTRWAYHNAPYTLLDNVLENATGQTMNAFTYSTLAQTTGITGLWVKLDDNNVFFSKARNMARYGILAQNNFVWDNVALLNDEEYKQQMVTQSQDINEAYGYLWWLNGTSKFMVPGVQVKINGSFAPAAPADMFAAMGKNGQFISVAKSKGLVFVRMGNAPEDFSEVPFLLCNSIWEKLNQVMCSSTGVESVSSGVHQEIRATPNPFNSAFTVDIPYSETRITSLKLVDMFGSTVKDLLPDYSKPLGSQNISIQVNTTQLSSGVYYVVYSKGNGVESVPVMKVK